MIIIIKLLFSLSGLFLKIAGKFNEAAGSIPLYYWDSNVHISLAAAKTLLRIATVFISAGRATRKAGSWMTRKIVL